MTVYFLRCAGSFGPIKIGYSAHPLARMRTINKWVPFDLEIIATAPGEVEVERRLHISFEHARYRTEWFRPTVGLLSLVDYLSAREDPTIPLRQHQIDEHAAEDGPVRPNNTAFDRLMVATDGTAVGCTTSSLARAANACDSSVDYRAFSDRKTIPWGMAERLAGSIGVNAQWLVDGTGPMMSGSDLGSGDNRLVAAINEAFRVWVVSRTDRDSDELKRLHSVESICHRACHTASSGVRVILVAPVGTAKWEIESGLSSAPDSSRRVEVAFPTSDKERLDMRASGMWRPGYEVVW